jgi:hypothetical protein
MLGALADAQSNLAVNGALDGPTVATFAGQFARGFRAEFDYTETYRLAATLISKALEKDPQFKPEISSGGKKFRIAPQFLTAVLNYYYVPAEFFQKRRGGVHRY